MSYWDILGIEPTVDIKVIKKAYGRNLKAQHPARTKLQHAQLFNGQLQCSTQGFGFIR